MPRSASIAVHRSQAEVFGGRFDGKLGVASAEIPLFQILMVAGDN